MQKWEYRIEVFFDEHEYNLNILGKNGWEVIWVGLASGRNTRYLLKRPKNEEDRVDGS